MILWADIYLTFRGVPRCFVPHSSSELEEDIQETPRFDDKKNI
jgi:hypothetical protein